MPTKTTTTAHGELDTSPYRKNRLETSTGIRLKAGVLVMPKVNDPNGVPPLIGQVQSIGRDGLVSVRWYQPEQNTPDIDGGTVAVDSYTLKLPASELLAITPQRAHLR